jgi:hypothetical protein
VKYGKGSKGVFPGLYYWQVTEDQIYLMTLYSKKEMSDLSAKEKKLSSKW